MTTAAKNIRAKVINVEELSITEEKPYKMIRKEKIVMLSIHVSAYDVSITNETVLFIAIR